MNLIEVYTEAKKLMEASKFNQGFAAANASGVCVNSDDPSACHFCTAGAVWSVIRRSKGRFSVDEFNACLPMVEIVTGKPAPMDTPIDDIYEWNDLAWRTKQDVLDLYDKVLLKLKETQ